MKWFAAGILILFLGIALSVVDCSANRGLTVGYYGEFNKLAAAVNALPGTRIEYAGYNRDVTLEEIYLWVTDSQGLIRYVAIGQDDPIRQLAGKRLEAALLERLAAAPVRESLPSSGPSRY